MPQRDRRCAGGGGQQHVVAGEEARDRAGRLVEHAVGGEDVERRQGLAVIDTRQRGCLQVLPAGLHAQLCRGAEDGVGEEAAPRVEVGLVEGRHIEFGRGLLDDVPQLRQSLGHPVHRGHTLRVDRATGVHRGGGDGDPQRPGTRGGVLGVAAHRAGQQVTVAGLGTVHRVEQPRAVAHGAGDGEFDAEAEQRVGEVGAGGGPATARLEADRTAGRGGDADRAAAVVGVRHRQCAAGDQRRRGAAGTAGAAVGGPRVAAGSAVGDGLGGGVEPEFRAAGDRADGQAGAAEPRDQVGVLRVGDTGAEQPAAAAAGHPARVRDEVLQRERHPGERAGLVVVERFVEPLARHGGQFGLDRVQGGRGRRPDLGRADLAIADQLRQTGGVVRGVFGDIHVILSSCFAGGMGEG